MDEDEYDRISQKFAKIISEDEDLSKFSIHQIANFLWYHTAVIIDAHVDKGEKERMRPVLDLINTDMINWDEPISLGFARGVEKGRQDFKGCTLALVDAKIDTIDKDDDCPDCHVCEALIELRKEIAAMEEDGK